MKTSFITRKLPFVFLFLFVTFISKGAFAQDARVIEIQGLNSMRYSKSEITAKPGEKITIRLTTISDYPASTMSHNFVLLKQDANVQALVRTSIKYKSNDYIAPKMMDQIIAHTAMASGGQTVEVTFTVPERPSKYMFICTFPGHFLSGMKGTLTVKN